MNQKITTVSDLYPREWLHPDDLPGPVTVAIEHAQIEPRYNPRTRREEPRLIVYFHNARRHLICNKTQAYELAEATGTEKFADWKGHLVALAVGQAPNRKPTITISSPQAPTPANTAAASENARATPAKNDETADDNAITDEELDSLFETEAADAAAEASQP